MSTANLRFKRKDYMTDYFGREKNSSYNQEISIEAPDESYFAPPEFNPDASPITFSENRFKI